MNYVKTLDQIKKDSEILNKRIAILSDDIIEMIRSNASLDRTYKTSVFRPHPDLAMLLFKKDRKSHYTINLVTLKPTANSDVQIMLSKDIIDLLV
jgi:hypothetical protein